MGENELIKPTMLNNEIIDIVKKCVQNFNKRVDDAILNNGDVENKPTFGNVLGPIATSVPVTKDLRKDVPHILALYMCVMDTKKKYPEYAVAADKYAKQLIENYQREVSDFLGDDSSIDDFKESIIKTTVNTKQEKQERIISYDILKTACHIAGKEHLVSYFTKKQEDFTNQELGAINQQEVKDEKIISEDKDDLKEAIDYFNVTKEKNIYQSTSVSSLKRMEESVKKENIILSSYYKITSLPQNKYGAFLTELYIRLRLKYINNESQKTAETVNLLMDIITKAERMKMHVSEYFVDTKNNVREIIKTVMDIIKEKTIGDKQKENGFSNEQEDNLSFEDIISILKENATNDLKTYTEEQTDDELRRNKAA